MKTLNRIVIFILIVSLLIPGCHQSRRIVNPEESDLAKSFVNPYAYMGEIHNDCLESVLTSLEAETDSTIVGVTALKDSISAWTVSFLSQDLDELGYLDFDFTDIFDEFTTTDTTSWDSLVYKVSWANKIQPYLVQMDSVLQTQPTASTVKTKFREIGFEVSKDTSLTSDQKIQLYCGLAVGESSALYWDEYYDDWSLALKNVMSTEMSSKGLPPIVIEVIIADLLGALKGAIFGGLHGAIIGAIIGSVATIVINWLANTL